MVTMNVLGPKTVQERDPVYFSVATYASNKGNKKMCSAGVQCKLLDFYENCDETAKGIHQALIDSLTKCNVNFGKQFCLPNVHWCK